MGINWAAKQATAHRMIKKAGAAANLRRGGADRAILACETDEFAREEGGRIATPLSKVILVSVRNAAGALVDPPDWQRDSYVDFTGTSRRMTFRQTALAPAGVAVYFEIKIEA